MGFAVVLTSTNSSLARYHLQPYEISNSHRKQGSATYPPYCRFLMIDCTVSTEYTQELENLRDDTTSNLRDFILKRLPEKSLFHLGRPIWACLYKDEPNVHFTDFAKEKLLKATKWNPEDESAALAVLAVRTNLLYCNVILNYERANKLVSSHMGTLMEVNETNDWLTFHFISEPVLSEAAAQVMSNMVTLDLILKKLSVMITSPTLTATGNMGELVGQLILLRAMDKAVEKRYKATGKSEQDHNQHFKYSLPVTVEEFLIGLVDEAHFNTHFANTVSKDFLEGLVCFSHFTQKADVLRRHGLIVDIIGSCAAGLFKPNFPRYDAFIVVFLKDRYGFMLFQIKSIVGGCRDGAVYVR
jgi:hypothetical protein